MYGTEDPLEDLKSKGVKTRLATQYTVHSTLVSHQQRCPAFPSTGYGPPTTQAWRQEQT